jgi:hypothetical protein
VGELDSEAVLVGEGIEDGGLVGGSLGRSQVGPRVEQAGLELGNEGRLGCLGGRRRVDGSFAEASALAAVVVGAGPGEGEVDGFGEEAAA